MMDTTRQHLQEADGLAAVLDAAYGAFEGMLSVIYPSQDPASGLFAAFVMAAASAANGRNALALAPSLPGRPLAAVPAGQQPWSGEPPERVAEVVATLSTLVAERLTQASRLSAGHRRPGRLPPCRPERPGYLRNAQQRAMTARPAFGDFITAARGHVGAAVAGHQADRSGEHVQEVSDSLLHVITVMDRYLQDITAVPGGMPSGASTPMTAWGQARLTAREALSHAARHLHAWRTRAPDVAARSELARQLDAAAAALTAGRDLLHTHLARDPRGARQFRSEWGLVVCSPPAERALLAELAWLAHQIAGPCADVALADRSPDTAGARRGLRAACKWLQVAGGSVQAAHRADPVSAADRDLLLAIPVNAPVPRPVLDGSEPVTALYDAVIASAERARHAAWVTGSQPAWSPHLTADSLRHVAATSTVTSHHCEILLRSLADRTAGSGTGRAQRQPAAGRRCRRARPHRLAAPRPRPEPGRHRHHAAPGPHRRRGR